MTNKELRNAVVAKGLTRLGKNQYTQGVNRDNVGAGWSDCSSFVRWCYKEILGFDIGSNTVNQITNKKLIEVCLGVKGQPDEAMMLPGDLLYYKGTDKSRPFMVGHVEMYIRKNRILGHGSGTGPKEQDMTNYNKSRYNSGKELIKVLRVIPADASDGQATNSMPPATSNGYLGFGQRELKYGNSGADVAALQRALILLGYSCGKWGIDGDFGTATKNAVIAFQYAKNLTKDGVVGVTTLASFMAALPEKGDNGDSAGDPPPAIGKQVMVIGGSSYVRDQPGEKGRILGVVHTGDKLPYRGETAANGWNAVNYHDENAWHSGRYGKVG